MRVLTRASDRFEAALEGGPVTAAVRADVDAATALASLAQRLPQPNPAFVGELRDRLLSQAGEVLARPPEGASRREQPGRAAAGARTLVLSPALRLLAGPVAAVVAALAVLGVAGRSALPGQSLYPVRELLERVEVALASGDRAKGVTLLDQAGRDIRDAAALAAASPPVAADVVTAVEAAATSATEGRAALFSDFQRTQDPSSLLAIREFVDRVSSDVDALAGVVPVTVDGAVARLRGLLSDMRTTALQTLAGCPTCGAAAQQARSLLTGVQGGATGAPSGTSPTPPAPPGTSATGGPGQSGTPSGGPVTSARPPLATVPVPTPNTPGLGGSPSVPGLPTTVPLPTVPLPSGSLSISVPVPVPTAPLPTGSVSISVPVGAPTVPTVPTVPPVPPVQAPTLPGPAGSLAVSVPVPTAPAPSP